MTESINAYFSAVFTLEDTIALPAAERLEEGELCIEQLVVTPEMIEAQLKG